ncbi:MAG: hypothetical protein ACW98K_18170 [Candidatus Kariarchaeaceae archaeon]|jgi:uncharacterized cupredoxin-like copper-binding protein
MKLKILLSIFLITMFASSVGSVSSEHNAEFPTNGCTTADHSIVITANGEVLIFVIDGKDNPEVAVDKDSCVEVTFNNTSDLDHDFTVVDESVDEEEAELDDTLFYEIIHMDTDAGNSTHHLWQMPDKDVTLDYFCEVAGHQAGGMEGTFKIGSGSSDDSALPGFGFLVTFIGLLAVLSIPIVKRRN